MWLILKFIVPIVLVMGAAGWTYLEGRKSGWLSRDGECKVQLADIESRAIEAERQAAATQAKARVLQARVAEEVANTREQVEATQRRMKLELDRMASRHKLVLRTELARVLNLNATIRVSGSPAADAGPGTDAPDAGPSSAGDGHSGGASEHSVVTWMGACKTGYETCRSRLHGLQEVVRAMVGGGV